MTRALLLLALLGCACRREPIGAGPVLARYGAVSGASTDAVFEIACSSFVGVLVADQSEDGESWRSAEIRGDDFRCASGKSVKVPIVHDSPLVRLRVAAYVSGALTVTPAAPDGGAR